MGRVGTEGEEDYRWLVTEHKFFLSFSGVGLHIYRQTSSVLRDMWFCACVCIAKEFLGLVLCDVQNLIVPLLAHCGEQSIKCYELLFSY